jgi:phage-related minor tail protein
LLGQIDPTVAGYERLDAMQAKLAAFKKSGAISGDDYVLFSGKIAKMRAEVGQASTAVHKFTLNNAAARRELGYITKDIATGQWGRMSQSLSTLAVRSNALSLIMNPLALGIAALAAAVVVFEQVASRGEQETRAFNTSLVQTGDYAGRTAAQLTDMSKVLAGVANGSAHAAAAGLAEVAATGKFTGEQFDIAAKAAVQFKDATGQAISATVAQFSDLQKDPVEALLKLNDTYHFLKQSQLDNIRSLQEQGRQMDAATEAFRIYGDEINRVSPLIVSNLSDSEKIWRGLKSTINDAADAVEEYGRKSKAANFFDTAYQLANPAALAANRTLDYLKNRGAPDSGQFANVTGGIVGDTVVNSEHVRAQEAWQREGLRYADKRVQLEDAIAKARAEGLKAGVDEIFIEERIARIRESYADKTPKPPDRKADDLAGKAVALIRKQIDA